MVAPKWALRKSLHTTIEGYGKYIGYVPKQMTGVFTNAKQQHYNFGVRSLEKRGANLGIVRELLSLLE